MVLVVVAVVAVVVVVVVVVVVEECKVWSVKFGVRSVQCKV